MLGEARASCFLRQDFGTPETPDATQLQKFYADLFDWKIDAGNPMKDDRKYWSRAWGLPPENIGPYAERLLES